MPEAIEKSGGRVSPSIWSQLTAHCHVCMKKVICSVLTVAEFFAGQSPSLEIFEAVRDVIEALGPVELRVSKSQIAFRRRRAFAWAWMPGRYLHGDVAPLVLTFAFRYRDSSPRWKEIVEPRAGSFTHHLELYSPADVDMEVRRWLAEAWADAGQP